ncbi:MAG: toll/interleukin-1 receptor domain-containing protein [Nitrospirales bacterium]
MKVIGQPENYSEMLERIFIMTLVVGFCCTVFLGIGSPDVKRVLDSIGTEAELGPIKGLKLLYVAIPLFIALISRAIKLHDRVSDILRLRYIIDTRWILIPLANGVGLELNETHQMLIKSKRKEAMYSVFYPYVSLPDAKIDRQLVRSALDNLGWFWSLLEAIVVVIAASALSYFLEAWSTGYMLAFAGILTCLTPFSWFACKGRTTEEVRAILLVQNFSNEIRNYFEGLLNKGASKASEPFFPSQVTQSSLDSSTYDVFISHASEDKDSIARPLYTALVAKGISVWFDEATLELGDSLRQKIDDGLARCRYGIVILSPRFLAKEWPQRELDGLVARETASGEKAILPVWHEIEAQDLRKYSPTLADRLAVRSTEGVSVIVEKILRVLEK